MTSEQLILSQSHTFAYKLTGKIPDPPIFNVKGLKYTVPPYYSYNHSETQWILNMIKSSNWERILRVVNSNPQYLNNTYCQYPDSPEPVNGQPMFHRKAILYLTPLALSIYLRQHKIATRMLEFLNVQGENVVNVNQTCFVTNYLERFENRSDIMIIYPFCILFRRECFEVVKPMLNAGWLPHESIELPYRRIFQIYVFHYKDVIEYCLSQMVTKPNLRLSKLFENLIDSMHSNFTLMKFEKLIYKDHNGKEVVDMISIPRRMLRYVFYYDKDMRILSQIMACLKIIYKHGFYVGPRRSSFEISLTPPKTGSDTENMINDQDNSIALLLAICTEADLKGHSQSREKLLDVLAHILIDTKWFVHFLVKDAQTLSDYFSNLSERVDTIKNTSIDLAKHRIIYLIDINEIDITIIEELYNPDSPKGSWKDNLNLYLESKSQESKMSRSSPDVNMGGIGRRTPDSKNGELNSTSFKRNRLANSDSGNDDNHSDMKNAGSYNTIKAKISLTKRQ